MENQLPIIALLFIILICTVFAIILLRLMRKRNKELSTHPVYAHLEQIDEAAMLKEKRAAALLSLKTITGNVLVYGSNGVILIKYNKSNDRYLVNNIEYIDADQALLAAEQAAGSILGDGYAIC